MPRRFVLVELTAVALAAACAILMLAPASATAQATALVGATVIDGTGGPPLSNAGVMREQAELANE